MNQPLGAGLLAVAVLGGCAAPRAALVVRQGGTSTGGPSLIGESAAALQARYGPPLLLRHDGPAEVWLYRSAACTVDLILYPDPHTGLGRVAVADVLTPAPARGAGSCLSGLAATSQPPPGRVAADHL